MASSLNVQQSSSGTSKQQPKILNQLNHTYGSPIVSKQMIKTKLCIDFQRQKCTRGDQCPYAHTFEEKRPIPNLRKTKLCSLYIAGSCTDQNCVYAHSKEELRFTCDFPQYRTDLCRFDISQGGRGCKYGEKCPYAHGIEELRDKVIDLEKNHHETLSDSIMSSTTKLASSSQDYPSVFSSSVDSAPPCSSLPKSLACHHRTCVPFLPSSSIKPSEKVKSTNIYSSADDSETGYITLQDLTDTKDAQYKKDNAAFFQPNYMCLHAPPGLEQEYFTDEMHKSNGSYSLPLHQSQYNVSDFVVKEEDNDSVFIYPAPLYSLEKLQARLLHLLKRSHIFDEVRQIYRIDSRVFDSTLGICTNL